MKKVDLIRHLEMASDGAITVDGAIPQPLFNAMASALERSGVEDTNPQSHVIGIVYVRDGGSFVLPLTPDGWEALGAIGAMAV